MSASTTFANVSFFLSLVGSLIALPGTLADVRASVQTDPYVEWIDYEHESGNFYTFFGLVAGDDLTNVTVTLGGLDSLTALGPISVNPDGSFSVTVELAPGEAGSATAFITGTSPFSTGDVVRVIRSEQ